MIFKIMNKNRGLKFRTWSKQLNKWLTKEEWDRENQSASFCPDGSLIANHDENDCKKGLIKKEGFSDLRSESTLPVVLLLAVATALWIRYKD